MSAPTASPAHLSQEAFADPEWRGEQDAGGVGDRTLRPMASLAEQESRLEDWIRGGATYGWLNAYEARRAGFELQSIRAQRRRDPFTAANRRAVQSRLDRLDAMLRRARVSGAA